MDKRSSDRFTKIIGFTLIIAIAGITVFAMVIKMKLKEYERKTTSTKLPIVTSVQDTSVSDIEPVSEEHEEEHEITAKDFVNITAYDLYNQDDYEDDYYLDAFGMTKVEFYNTLCSELKEEDGVKDNIPFNVYFNVGDERGKDEYFGTIPLDVHYEIWRDPETTIVPFLSERGFGGEDLYLRYIKGSAKISDLAEGFYEGDVSGNEKTEGVYQFRCKIGTSKNAEIDNFSGCEHSILIIYDETESTLDLYLF